MNSGVLCFIAVGIVLISVGLCIFMWIYTRKRLKGFAGKMIGAIQILEEGGSLEECDSEAESLEGKLTAELMKLSKIYSNAKTSSSMQKKEIQQMVSDISHQLKTPIANIVMYNDMVLEREMPREEQVKYLQITKTQVEKLEFLVQALVKMSRVESAMIVLEPRRENLFQCVAQAVSGITAKAEKKELQVEVTCPEEIVLSIDQKWTTEAIENVLENAVKYTPEGGRIDVTVNRLELFTRIDIKDTGIGIEEKQYNDVFKRFWRAPGVHQKEGVGIGLYLTREIITRQGGYMKVHGVLGQGSCFSIYLPT